MIQYSQPYLAFLNLICFGRLHKRHERLSEGTNLLWQTGPKTIQQAIESSTNSDGTELSGSSHLRFLVVFHLALETQV